MNDKLLTFETLGLSKSVLIAIKNKGFEEPSPIQALTIPIILGSNANIMAQAQTGTGKTAAFGLPLVEKISAQDIGVQALILVPTRELAIQVAEEIITLKGDIDLQIVPVYGGQSIDQQLRRLKRGVQIVVGTPGRVIDHINRQTLNLRDISYLILDEADEMLNMGFIDDMEEIMKHTNPQKRTFLFSATMPSRIKDLAKKYMGHYESVSVEKQPLTTSLTEQIYYEVKESDKFESLCRIIDIEEDFYGLVFCRTKNDVDQVVAHLNDRSYDAEAIHGDILQKQRENILEKFKKKKINILVATDVAARGIDINNLSHVINYSLPHDPESYVHRIGRTGRAGKQGTAITFITPSEYKKLMFIQRVSKTDIKKSKVPKIEDIIAIKKKKINEEVNKLSQKQAENFYINWAKTLLDDYSAEQVLANLLSYCFNHDLDPNSYNTIQDLSANNSNNYGNNYSNNYSNNEGRSIEIEGKTRLFVALGKKDKITPAKLVQLIIDSTGVKNSLINQVEVYNDFSFLTVPFKEAEIILHIFKKKSGAQKPLVVKAKKI